MRCVEGASDFEVPKPTKTQAKWLDYEVGAIVHFNMQTFDRYMKPGKSQLCRDQIECLLVSNYLVKQEYEWIWSDER